MLKIHGLEIGMKFFDIMRTQPKIIIYNKIPKKKLNKHFKKFNWSTTESRLKKKHLIFEFYTQ